MTSITYQAAPCQAQPHFSTSSPDEPLVRQFWDEAKRQVVTGDYLRRKWMPRQGHRFYILIKVLRGYCSYSIKQGEAPCFPSYETIAQACHVCRRTICTWLAHDEQGCFIHPRHGEALNRFVRVQPRRRYDPVGQRQVKTSNIYLVRMDDPVTSEDEALVWEKATVLARRHLEQQHEEQERQALRAPFREQDCILNNGQNVHPQRGAETTQDRHVSTPLVTSDFHRSTRGEGFAGKATRSGQAAAHHPANRTRDEEDETSGTIASTSNSATAQRPEDQFRRAAPLDEATEECQREERKAALQASYEAAGGVVYSLLEELGDTNATGGTRKVLTSLVASGAPTAQMADLAYLARDRVRAFVLRGGRILDTQVGFYITTLCNLAREARRKGWKLDTIAAADRRRHERLLRRGKQRMPGQTPPQEPQRAGRQAQRRRAPPTPAEVEALVMSLGQQEETYAKAQAQVQKIQEERQGREARQQAVQQQALLFSQLDQANRALQQHPVGSLAWERAQREQQEIERRIAAWRSPAGAAVPAAGQLDTLYSKPPATGQPAQPQDRSESEYREAIQGWARAHGWTVRHGTFGGSQRDWQIGLMGVSRRDLAQLAADLGV